MLPSIQIKNFKNIKNLEISTLSQVNLITGKNNTSKTSLLEAIGMWASDLNFEWIIDIISKREELIVSKILYDGDDQIDDFKSLISLFSDREIDYDGKKNIYIGYKEDYVEIGFVKYIEEKIEKISRNGKVSTIGKKTTKVKQNEKLPNALVGLEINKNMFETILPTNNVSIDLPTVQSKTFLFVTPYLQEREVNGLLWDKITLSEKEDYIISALKIIEPDIEKIAFIKKPTRSYDERSITAKLKNIPKRVPLKSMGDGINRILSVALALVNSENGYLLIDEFENGLHYSVQEKLWEVVFMLAKKLNVQVFATTHSEDCLRAFAEVTNSKNHKNLGQLIRLEKTNTGIKAIDFQSEELRIANENDIDIR
jgi:AAA15 family ATPase/GTPase